MSKKKKILLLSDDMRMSSGIATMSKSLVMGTVDTYDWFQVGAAVNHPDKGKVLDLSKDIQNRTGVDDASVRILPWSGYGNPDLVRQIINSEKVDAILHFTDPRYWTWLYDMEHEIRQNIPIMYYTIWDNLPDPQYNRNYYESCDWLATISKQTYGIVSRLTSKDDAVTYQPHSDWQVSYVPHGIDENEFKPTEVPNEFRNKVLGDKEYEFVFFWSNRNIRRKQPSDVIMAFKEFCQNIPDEKADKVVLLMHTSPSDQNGTDLPAVAKTLAPDCNILFSENKLNSIELNYLYNIADTTINIAGNEGFGLTTAESVMAGTPIIVNVTGGLQDQCGFKWNVAPSNMNEQWEYITADDYKEIGSLHDYKKWADKVKWGEWVNPIWSKAQSLTGSVPTPYIWDDKINITDLADAMFDNYSTSSEELKNKGLEGRRAFIEELGLTKNNMCKQMVDGIERTFKNWKPKKRFEVFRIK